MWGPIECGMRKVANWSVMKYIRNILYERVSIKDEILTHDELLHQLKVIKYKYMYEFSHSAHIITFIWYCILEHQFHCYNINPII